jgi:hypothetical protein
MISEATKTKLDALLEKDHFEFVKKELLLIKKQMKDVGKHDPDLFKLFIKQKLLRLISYNNSNITKNILVQRDVIEDSQAEKRKYPGRMGHLKQVINYLKTDFDVDDK